MSSVPCFTIKLPHLMLYNAQRLDHDAGYNHRGAKRHDAVSTTSADSQPILARRPKRSASPGQALQDVTSRLQALRLGNAQPSGHIRGSAAEAHNLGSARHYAAAAGAIGDLAADPATIRGDDNTDQPVVAASRKASTAIAADMQDIDKRLANLQQFLQQTKTPG